MLDFIGYLLYLKKKILICRYKKDSQKNSLLELFTDYIPNYASFLSLATSYFSLARIPLNVQISFALYSSR